MVILMDEVKGKEHDDFFNEFLKEIQREIDYHTNGGTSFRRTSAEFSLQVAMAIGEFSPFLDRKSSEEIVTRLHPNLSIEKKKDISKMMNVIARELYRKANMADEIRRYLQERKQ
ncbi:hypothetical protein [Neobacillus endophyticus]|uniref:hypothetical protein n=1 Tax=Neobacillus endophyticus TaxID=2738405 RepID=UPI001C25F4B8|nr:hypothetical protein [Neobacillus endophyticus]